MNLPSRSNVVPAFSNARRIAMRFAGLIFAPNVQNALLMLARARKLPPNQPNLTSRERHAIAGTKWTSVASTSVNKKPRLREDLISERGQVSRKTHATRIRACCHKTVIKPELGLPRLSDRIIVPLSGSEWATHKRDGNGGNSFRRRDEHTTYMRLPRLDCDNRRTAKQILRNPIKILTGVCRVRSVRWCSSNNEKAERSGHPIGRAILRACQRR
jgi:hypothetical protein